MWQEARKQEKKLRGMMVDHKKRAERRREYYEKIKLDPTQFLQVHGRRSKIHLDIHVALAGDDPKTMMPWQGDKEIMIDRFDVRAHLDYIPDVKANASDDFDQESEKRLREINYERYRILVQNDFVKVGETRFLKTIELEEQFGGKTYQAQKAKDDKKKSKESKAAIAFTYEDSTTVEPKAPAESGKRDQDDAPNDPDGGDDSDSDIDLDMTVDIMAMGHESRQEINGVGKSYRMGREDFMKFLAQDIHEQEELKAAKLAEEERAQHTGRKSRRERRLLKERRMVGRRLSPPSYASRHMTIRTFGSGRPEVGDEDEGSGHNSSRSPSPVIPGKVEFITSFGGDSDSERKNDVAIGSSRMSSTSKSRLKNLRRNLSPSPRSDIPIGPMLPLGAGQLRRPSQTQHSRRARRSRSRSHSPKSRRSRSPNQYPRKWSRSTSRTRHRRRQSRSRSPKRRRSRTRSVERRKSPARSRKASPSSDSSSSSSSSAGNGTKPDVKYRSKYRNRRRSSSSESEGKPEKNATDKGKNNGKSVGKRGRSSSSSTSSPSPMRKQSVEVETKPEPAKPIQSYYERIRQNVVKDSDSDDLDVEPDEHSQLSKPKHRDDSNGDGRNDTNPDTKSNDREASNSLKDKIRKRMQAQIKKQFRMDKLAEEERKRKLDEERLYREEEMRELALKMRRKEREKRHDFDSGSESEPVRPSSSNSDDKDDRKRGQVPGQSASRGEHQPKSRSESRSPKRRRSRDRSRSREQLHRTRPLSPNGDKGKIRLVDY